MAMDTSNYRSVVEGKAGDYWGTSKDQMDWAKKEFDANKATSDKVVGRALDTSSKFGDQAGRSLDEYQGYEPARKQQLDFAQNYTTKGRMDANRASAIAGSNLAFNRQAKNAQDNLMSFGVDPSSGRYAGLSNALATKAAMGAASAGTKSDRDTEMLGQQYLANAINTGKQVGDTGMGMAGVGMAAGNQAVNAGLATTASGAQTMGTGLQWAGLGNDMQKESLAAQTAQGKYDLEQQKLEEGKSSGTGAMIGAGLGMLGGIAGNFLMPGIGGSIGGSLGKMAGGMATSGGKMAASGGLIDRENDTIAYPKDNSGGYRPGSTLNFRAGGPVPPEMEDEEDDGDSGEPALNMRPTWRQMQEPEWPESDSAPTPPTTTGPYDEESPEAPDVPHFQQGGTMAGDHNDMTDHYNTELTLEEEDAFRKWAAKHGRDRDTYDYDLRGAWKYGLEPDENNHLPDTFKKPNHPTFSDQSIYHGRDGHRGGRWDSDETGSETLQPYDRRYDPAADRLDADEDYRYRSQVNRGALTSNIERLMSDVDQLSSTKRRINPDDPFSPERQGGLTESERIRQRQFRDPAEAFRHPTYDQLSADRDLRRGQTRMAPRLQEGGDVTSGVGQNPNMVPAEASPSRGANTDDVHAMVQVGEFVMPEDVSRWYGEKYLQGLIEKARRDMSQATAQPESAPMPQAMAVSPPAFRSEGARA